MWRRNQLLIIFSRFFQSESTGLSIVFKHFRMSSSASQMKNDSFVSQVTKDSTRPYTIIVEGNIGSGKTTFLEPFSLHHEDMVEVLAEPVDLWRNCQGHNLLQLMYDNPGRYSLAFQTYVQLTMVKLHNKPTDKPIRLMERSLLRHQNIVFENILFFLFFKIIFSKVEKCRKAKSNYKTMFSLHFSARYCFVENLFNKGLMADCEYAVISEWYALKLIFIPGPFK